MRNESFRFLPCFKACVILSNVADETIIAEFIEKNSDTEKFINVVKVNEL